MATDSKTRDAYESNRLPSGRDQTRLRFAANEIICRQDDPAEALFYDEVGQVNISVVTPSGKQAVIGLRGEGDFFGVRSLLSGDHRLTTVTASSDCAIMRIKKTGVKRLLRDHADFAEMFISYLLRQHLRDQESLIDQLTNSAEKRLARVMLQLANYSRADDTLTIRANQTMLANMTGTTRARVNSFMNKFRRHGYIEYNGQGLITVRNALRKVLFDD